MLDMLTLKPPSRHFNNMFIAYTKGMNKTYQRSGSLFEKPFRGKIVECDSYFAQLVIYIHRNPQKHGLIDDFRKWPWSSYQTIRTLHATRLNREAVLGWFGTQANFRQAHTTDANETHIQPLIADDWL